MVDEGGERVLGKRRLDEGEETGIVPTGAYLTTEGSSVETEGDIASSEPPEPDEILRLAEEHRQGLHPDEEVLEEAPELEEPFAPHERGGMAEIE